MGTGRGGTTLPHAYATMSTMAPPDADRLARLLRAGVSLANACKRVGRARSGVYLLLQRGERSGGHWHTRYAYEAIEAARGRELIGPERYRKMRQQRALRRKLTT